MAMSSGKQSFIPFGTTAKNTKVSVSSDEESSDNEMLDLSKDLFSLSHYVDDEEELVSQLFTTIKLEKLKSLMPPILRNIPAIYLQELCLHELTGMSRNRILAAINGEEMSSSSSDSDESEDEATPEVDLKKPIETSSTVKKELPPIPNNDVKTAETVNINKTEIKEDMDIGDIEKDEELSGLTTLDIVELQMRRNLIKTMLEKQKKPIVDPTDKKIDTEVVIKQEPMSPTPIEDQGAERKSRSVSRHSSVASDRSRKRQRSFVDKSSSRSRSRSRSFSSSRSRTSHSRKSRARSSSLSSRSRSRSKSIDSYGSRSASDGSRNKSHTSSSAYSSSDDSTHNTKSSKGRKLTKKEFQERMKKAKMNRSYRKRTSDNDLFDDGDDDEEDLERKRKKQKKWKKNMEKKLFERSAQWEKQYFESLKKELKEKKIEEPKAISQVAADKETEEGEIPEVEEGEIDSTEELEEHDSKKEITPPPVPEEKEEGACSASEEEKRVGKDGTIIEKITTYEDKPSKKRKRKPKISQVPEKSRKRLKKVQVQPITENEIQIPSPEGDTLLPDLSKQEKINEITSELNDEENSRTEPTQLPCKSVRQSISFSLPKKGLPVSRTDIAAPVSTASSPKDEESSSDEEFAAPVMDENIEIIGESTDEEPSTSGQSAVTAPRPPSATDTEVPSPFETKDCILDSTENSRDEKIDIIGVIEAKDEDSMQVDDDELLSSSSWSTRWLQSEKVQTVVTNTKLLSKVRKKFQMKKGKKKQSRTPSPVQSTVPVSNVEQSSASAVIGSIEEYEKIVGVKVQPSASYSHLEESLAMFSDGSEDSEEEALWSQIMKS